MDFIGEKKKLFISELESNFFKKAVLKFFFPYNPNNKIKVNGEFNDPEREYIVQGELLVFYLIISYLEVTTENTVFTSEEKEFYSNLQIDLTFQESENTPLVTGNKMVQPKKKTIFSESSRKHKPELESITETLIFSQIENNKDIKDEFKGVSVSHKSSYKPKFMKLMNGDILFEFAISIEIDPNYIDKDIIVRAAVSQSSFPIDKQNPNIHIEQLLNPNYKETRSPIRNVERKLHLIEPLHMESIQTQSITVGHTNYLTVQMTNNFDLPVEIQKMQISPMSGRSIDRDKSEPILLSDFFTVTFETPEELPITLYKGCKMNILVVISPKPSAYNDFYQGNFTGIFDVLWNIPCLQTNIISSSQIHWIGPKAHDIIISITADTPAVINQLFRVKVSISNLSNVQRELRLTIGEIVEGNISRVVSKFAGKDIERSSSSLKKKKEDGLIPIFCLQKEIRVGVLKPKGSTNVSLEFMPLKEGVFHVEDLILTDLKHHQEFINVRPFEMLVVKEKDVK